MTIEAIKSFFKGLADAVIKLLPLSPFEKYIDALEELPYLSTLNWFVPIGGYIAILEAWLTAIAVYYLYMIVLRWVKAID